MIDNAENNKYYTVTQAAEILQCSSHTVRLWIKTGVIQAVKLGKSQQSRYLIPEDEIPAFIRRKENGEIK